MQGYSLDDLLYLMARLRDPDSGCPWDLQQDFKSIANYTLEECYELIDAIETGDTESIRQELGDLLFQVVFYSRLGAEQGDFDFTDVVDTITGKLVRRHPHVFPDGELRKVAAIQTGTAEIRQRWEGIKAGERASRGLNSVLDDVPVALPALTRAGKLQKRSSTIGLDWPRADLVLDTLQSELDELRAALDGGDTDAIAHEMGDVLFSAVNVSRHLRVDAEQVLRSANRRFEQRVRLVEEMLAGQGDEAVSESLLDEFWQKAKQKIVEQAT